MQFEITDNRALLPAMVDPHVHLRRKRKKILRQALVYSARVCDVIGPMPNTKPSILVPSEWDEYREEIQEAQPNIAHPMYLRYLKLTQDTTPVDVQIAALAGIHGYKGYPDAPGKDDVTTHSSGGVSSYYALEETIVTIFRLGLVLLVHPEHPTAFCFDRETEFLGVAKYLIKLARIYNGRLSFEHASTEALLSLVDSCGYENVLVTGTLQHLLFTADSMLGGLLDPHLFCKPLLKRPEDREALRSAFLNRLPWFALGSDSAPHFKGEKECPHGCAGVFSSPVLAPRLLMLALELCEGDRARALETLIHFTSTVARRFYRLPPPAFAFEMVSGEWLVPRVIGGAVPLCARETLPWMFNRRITS